MQQTHLVAVSHELVPEQDAEYVAHAHRVTGYRVTHVWDLSQTSGRPLPERPVPRLLQGQAPSGLWDAMSAAVLEHGFTLQRGETGNANGLTHFGKRTITVRPDVDDAQAVKTLAHELGHVLLHEPGSAKSVVACRGVIEVEAESVAYLVAASHGMDTGSYTFPYVVGWAGSVAGRTPEEIVADVGQRVLRAANQVLDRVPPAGDDNRADALGLDDVTQRVRATAERASALADAAPHASPHRTGPVADVDRQQLLAAHNDAAEFFARHVPSSSVPDYLAGRGLAAVLQESSPWEVGYAPRSWTALTDHLRAAGYGDETIQAAGMALEARTGRLVDRFRDRLVLPVRDGDGRVVAFVGRAHPNTGDRIPRYLNSPTTAIYSKGEQLLGLVEGRTATRGGATPVLVEGPMDALAVWVASNDRHTPVALCGTALTRQQADVLASAAGGPGAPIVVATDADDAGRSAAEVAYRHLTGHSLQPWAADLPPGIDPAELLETHGPRRLAATLTTGARPLIDDVIDHRVTAWSDRLRWVDGRVDAVRDIAPLIAALPEDQRARSIARVVDLVGVEPETARREVYVASSSPPVSRITRGPRIAGRSSGRDPTASSTGVPRRALVHRSISR